MPEQYLEDRGKVVLNSSPGSGKTRAVVAKTVKLISASTRSHQGLLVLSFTNPAVDEIADRFSTITSDKISYPNLLSTIDSFTNHFITIPYGHLLLGKHPLIAEDNEQLNSAFDSIKFPIKFKTSNKRPFKFAYRPSDISYSSDGVLLYKHRAFQNALFQEYAKWVKNLQFRMGLLSTSDSGFLALKILADYPIIAKAIANRFHTIIVDEAQDTSAIQDKLLSQLHAAGLLNIDLVGDPYQSLYEWRGAAPKLFYSKLKDPSWKAHELMTNHRSSQRIVDAFSLLRRNRDTKIKADKQFTPDLPVTIYRYNSDDIAALASAYNEECDAQKIIDRKIIAWSNEEVDSLNPIPPVGAWNLNSMAYRVVESIMCYRSNLFQKAVSTLRALVIELLNPNTDARELREKRHEAVQDHMLSAKSLGFIKRASEYDSYVAEWTETMQLDLQRTFNLPSKPSFEFKNLKQLAKVRIQDVFHSAALKNENVATTIHSLKGREAESVMVILSVDNLLSIGVGTDQENYFPSEPQRVMYVGMSRPQRFLALGVPNTIDEKTIEGIFGDVNIVSI